MGSDSKMMRREKNKVTDEQFAKFKDDPRLDQICTLLFPNLSRKSIKKIIDSGGAYVNQKRELMAKRYLKIGDQVEIYWKEAGVVSDFPLGGKQSTIKSGLSPFEDTFDRKNLVLENKNYVVIHKPAGVPSQSTLESVKGTIIEKVTTIFPEFGSEKDLFLVHRLDKDTSGLMILARNPSARAYFEEQFREHKIKKTYQAIVFGKVTPSSGMISYSIGKSSYDKNTYFPIYSQKSKSSNTKSAFTKYSLKTYNEKKDISWVECIPTTGRTHQIRVHLMALGFPIVGDKTYAKNMLNHPCSKVSWRHLLHASHLEFKDPSGAPISLTLECPPEMKQLFESDSF
jgi:23S rRNA pseudouridine1911/1915/1917 synthase